MSMTEQADRQQESESGTTDTPVVWAVCIADTRPGSSPAVFKFEAIRIKTIAEQGPLP